MSFLAGLFKDTGSDLLSSAGDINLGDESLNAIFANLTIFSLFLTTLRSHVVKGRTRFDTHYDYIIIGGGTAGSIMASRLSQHPCVKVLLLEAGGEQPILSFVPGFARGFLGTAIDWSYYTTPQKYSAFGQKDRKVLWGSGKVLGGGSSINAMLYVRGNRANFDQWARMGATGWNYDAVFKYFLKLEDNKNIDELDPGYHSQGGPMGAEKSHYHGEVRRAALEALQALGYPMTDTNGERAFGIYDLQGTVRNQERCSTSTAYLKPASRRHNLHIVTNAFVTKILIDKRNGNRATGVAFEYENKQHFVFIGNSDYIKGGFGEVILSNGATRTPQTLMLSGIGPKEQLDELGIPVLVNLQGVGKNLQDHVSGSLLYELDPIYRNALGKQLTPESFAEYVLFRQGPQCSYSQVNLLAFLNGLNNTNPPYDFPMQQLYFLDYNVEDAVRTYNIREEIEKKVYTPYILNPVMICWSQLLQPFSRGEITLSTIDPHEYPNINPNYYADPRDVHYVVEGMKICEAAARTPGMQRIKARLIPEQRSGYPGCEHLEGYSDEYLACLARSVVVTIWHPVGTAKMGDPRDPMAVVDPQLRVFGVDKLRVISAAVMPVITSGNTNVPTMMIAEKGYDMMKDNILCPSTLTIHGKHQVADQN